MTTLSAIPELSHVPLSNHCFFPLLESGHLFLGFYSCHCLAFFFFIVLSPSCASLAHFKRVFYSAGMPYISSFLLKNLHYLICIVSHSSDFFNWLSAYPFAFYFSCKWTAGMQRFDQAKVLSFWQDSWWSHIFFIRKHIMSGYLSFCCISSHCC